MQKKTEVNNQDELKNEEAAEAVTEKQEDLENPASEETQDVVDEAAADQDEIAALKAEVEKLQAEKNELKTDLLRKHADFENFRKRMNKEKDDSIRYANQMLLLDLTDTIDNFERAMKSAAESKDFDAFHSGVIMIEKQLVSMLENKWGLKRFISEGEAFDPERHQAIAVSEEGDYEVETVVEDFQRGYLFHERVLRPAKVRVCKPSAGAESDANNEQE